MKKVCLILMVLALAVGMFAAQAAEAKPGEEVTVALSLKNTNAAYIRVTATYDSNVFEFVSYSAASGTAGAKGIVVYDTKVLSSGSIGTVTLRVKDNAQAGTYTIGAVLAECYDLNENDGKATVSGDIVTIVGKAAPTPTAKPTAAPTAKPTEAPKPTEKPTETTKPTEKPVETPRPTEKPTEAPQPTEKPTETTNPTEKPVETPRPTEKPTDAPKPTEKPAETPAPQEMDMRYHQSVCSLGIRFRDIKPGITMQWNMFTPLDLSMDGTQTIDLIAANITYAGYVTVQVKDGKVKVDYHLQWPMEKNDMQFTILPDLDSVSSADIQKMPSYSFGKEISIADDLKGDTNVLLYVLGYVNYNFKDARYETFVANDANYQQLVTRLESIMD